MSALKKILPSSMVLCVLFSTSSYGLSDEFVMRMCRHIRNGSVAGVMLSLAFSIKTGNFLHGASGVLSGGILYSLLSSLSIPLWNNQNKRKIAVVCLYMMFSGYKMFYVSENPFVLTEWIWSFNVVLYHIMSKMAENGLVHGLALANIHQGIFRRDAWSIAPTSRRC